MSSNFWTNLDSFWHSITGPSWWQIAIECFLIGIAVFFILRFLEGTRGARMLRGIALVLVVMFLLVDVLGERVFHLLEIGFLYDNFMYFAVIALAVVFQPELRRGLMRLGETRLFRGWSGEVNDDIDQIVESATFLSRRKIGAVVAIEREVGLGGIAESGTKINADLTADLLNTIFWPNSPLHDLGVIVSHGRVAYASVQFPLAESGDLERELGSRHRAAVGMSQESDALVVVVSEETGDISLAESGKLIRKLTPDGLRGLLSELLGRTGGSLS
jgi:diadenylate cyclase